MCMQWGAVYCLHVQGPTMRHTCCPHLAAIVHTCVQDPTIWAALAAMAMANKELSTAEVAFAAIDEVDKLHFVIKVSSARRLGRMWGLGGQSVWAGHACTLKVDGPFILTESA